MQYLHVTSRRGHVVRAFLLKNCRSTDEDVRASKDLLERPELYEIELETFSKKTIKTMLG